MVVVVLPCDRVVVGAVRVNKHRIGLGVVQSVVVQGAAGFNGCPVRPTVEHAVLHRQARRADGADQGDLRLVVGPDNAAAHGGVKVGPPAEERAAKHTGLIVDDRAVADRAAAQVESPAGLIGVVVGDHAVADIDGNGVVNIADMNRVAQAYLTVEQPMYVYHTNEEFGLHVMTKHNPNEFFMVRDIAEYNKFLISKNFTNHNSICIR